MSQSSIYLDHAAATPVDKQVLVAMQPYFSEQFFNPSATYSKAQAVKKALEQARADIAMELGARPTEVVFTAGGSEANNLAIQGLMKQYPEGNIVVSAVEHDSVLAAAGEYNCRIAPVTAEGIVDLKKLAQLIDTKTVLVSVMYANNEVGTIQPIREVVKLAQALRAKRSKDDLPLYVHTDAAQAANFLDIHTARLGVDLMSLNGGKIYGPKASGALFVKSHVRLLPLILGGGQERGLRSGTENVPTSIGFALALKTAQAKRKDEQARLMKLQQQCLTALTAMPGATINGSMKHRLPNNIHVTFDGQDNERLLFALDEQGIMAAAGSACSASSEEPSHVLKAMGLSDKQAQSSLRFTLGRSTTEADITKLVSVLTDVLRKEKVY